MARHIHFDSLDYTPPPEKSVTEGEQRPAEQNRAQTRSFSSFYHYGIFGTNYEELNNRSFLEKARDRITRTYEHVNDSLNDFFDEVEWKCESIKKSIVESVEGFIDSLKR